MSDVQLQAFLEKVQTDLNPLEKLKTAPDPASVVKITKEAGYNFSAEISTTYQLRFLIKS